jgi:hypothetical protein
MAHGIYDTEAAIEGEPSQNRRAFRPIFTEKGSDQNIRPLTHAMSAINCRAEPVDKFAQVLGRFIGRLASIKVNHAYRLITEKDVNRTELAVNLDHLRCTGALGFRHPAKHLAEPFKLPWI